MTTITGQLMVRETNTMIDGRKVVMVFGLLAAAKGEVIDLKGEHQYTISGGDLMGDYHFTLFKDSAVDRTNDARGDTPSGLLCLPIWRF